MTPLVAVSRFKSAWLILWLAALWLVTTPTLQAAGRVDVPTLAINALDEGISLAGQWRFQPGDNLDWAEPGFNDAHWSTLAAPRRWPGAGYPETGQFAWYRLTLQFDPNQRDISTALTQLGLRLPKVLSAYEVYAGGYLLGGVGKLPPLSEVNYDRERVYSIPPQAVDASGRLVLALRVWGGDQIAVKQFGGGISDGKFELGVYSKLLMGAVMGAMPGVLVAALFAGFGFYHIYLYRRNRQLDALLWFGIMAVDIAIYALMQNQWKYVLGLDFVTYEKVEFAAIYLFPALVVQMLWSLLGIPIRPWLRAYQMVFPVAAVAVATVPGLGIHYYTLEYYQLYSLPLLIAVPGIILRRALQGHSEARTLVIGALIFAATCLNDILIDLVRLDANRLVPYGFVAVMLSMAVSLANRFTNMLNQLEVEVAERTADLQQANEQLYRAARHDPLTGVMNRRGFIAEAEAEIQRMFRSGREFSIILADIDNFKGLNDRYGHACGDHVLKRLATLLRQQVRDVDKVGRWGGEEFILLLPETNAEGAAVLAEKLRSKIADNLFEFSDQRLQVTMTFGLTSHRKGESLDACVARADTALYTGKQRGRNRVMIGNYKGLTLVN